MLLFDNIIIIFNCLMLLLHFFIIGYHFKNHLFHLQISLFLKYFVLKLISSILGYFFMYIYIFTFINNVGFLVCNVILRRKILFRIQSLANIFVKITNLDLNQPLKLSKFFIKFVQMIANLVSLWNCDYIVILDPNGNLLNSLLIYNICLLSKCFSFYESILDLSKLIVYRFF